ncbi:MAG: hypothetical protein WAQ32_06790, partial [Dethiobacteria bacterium]
VSEKEFQDILKSHVLSPEFLYADDFVSFFNDRKEKILQRIEKAMNKPILREAAQAEEGVYIDEDEDVEEEYEYFAVFR